MPGKEVAARKADLSPQQKVAAAMVAAGRTDSEIAAEVGVAVSTISAWRKREDFKAAVNVVLGEVSKNIVRRAYAAVPQAMEYLISCLTDPGVPHTQKIQAARTLIDRFPAFTPELAAEPLPEAKAVPDSPTSTIAPSTVLDIVREIRAIEEARKRTPVVNHRDGYDDDDDDDQDEPVVRLVQGFVVQDDPETDPETDDPAGAMGAPAGSSPVEPEPQPVRRPGPATIKGDDLLREIARSRGAGPGGGHLGGSRGYTGGGGY